MLNVALIKQGGLVYHFLNVILFPETSPTHLLWSTHHTVCCKKYLFKIHIKVKYNYLKDKPSSSGQGLVFMIQPGIPGKKTNQKLGKHLQT